MSTANPLDSCWLNREPPKPKASQPAPVQSPSLPPEYLTIRQACELLGLGERRFHEIRDEDWMPRPVAFGPRALRYSRTELLAAAANRAPRPQKAQEPQHLQAARVRKAVAA